VGLHELTLRNFRLFTECVFRPDPAAVTVLLSPNGSGKTSILEAVYALATASSFRTTTAVDMVRTASDVAEVHGVIFQQERRIQVDLTLTKGVRAVSKRMLVNGQRPTSRAALSAVLPITIFTPEGVDVVRHGPEHRRVFLTTLLTDADLSTGEVIERYARVLQQRNALLKQWQGQRLPPSVDGELAVWNGEFCAVAEQLLAAREALLVALSPLVAMYYQDLAQNTLPVTLTYERSWTGELMTALQRSLHDDLHRGYSTIGPHRDDVALHLAGRDARRQASQGEQRSFALALRLAGHAVVRQQRGIDPLLLLDDVFSELDPIRSDRLLHLLPVGQTLVTTASPLPSGMTPAAIVDISSLA
jgi:DNA replication and repair protein RecF